MAIKGRIFSGMRPSGRLHLGNWLGALQNWVSLQEEYDCIFCAVDVHALTTINRSEDTRDIQKNIHEMVLDWLAAGLDPNKSTLFVQSHVPEVLTLHTLLSMVTPLGWLLRVPTFKDRVRQMEETEESVSYGLVGYPVLMTADIILYKADTVPVGEDQVPHIELAREIVRRFNSMFGPTFIEPQAVLTETPLVIGLDGQQKMSKTLNNHLELASSAEQTTTRLKTAFTDPMRLRRSDPGRPSVCNIYSLHKLFNQSQSDTVEQECLAASRGCVDCKIELANNINESFSDFRDRREEYSRKPDMVREILQEGQRKVRVIAQDTILEVRDRLGLT